MSDDKKELENGETLNKSASNDVAGTAPADSETKPGGATPEQQEKAAELQNADPAAQTTSEPSDAPAAETKPAADSDREAKIKAAQEARAARLAAKAAAEGGADAPSGDAQPAVDSEREAKIKAAQEARAARLAAKAATEGGEAAPSGDAQPAAAGGDDDKEAKAKAAAEARAARAAARAKAAEPEGPKEPSPKQPVLDRLVEIIKENVGDDAIETSYINERDAHIPTVVIKSERWVDTARVLKQHVELKLQYLRNVTGVDVETHMEVIYHLISFESKQNYCIKVKTPRDQASVPSVTPIWATANWNEREIYDLFGIDFPGHPDLRRIMMPDDWVGHPLRKDYQPLDPEV